MKQHTHRREILLIEDREDNYRPMIRWLEREKYEVTLATTLEEALAQLDSRRFHLTLVDIRLVDEDENNEVGLLFLEEVVRRKLDDVMPRIVITAHSTEDRLDRSLQQYRVAHYIRKGSEYLTQMVECVEKVFQEQVRINFNLSYDTMGDSVLRELADQIYWEVRPRPPREMLVAELHDLFGRLFHDAERIFFSSMTPGLTGAVVVRVRPTWPNGPGHSYVLKFNRRDKVETEAERYQIYVARHIPMGRTELVNTAYTRNLGVLQYTFVGGDVLRLQEFDAYYKQNEAEEIVYSLDYLFDTICGHWYGNRDNRYHFLPDLYWDAFDLDQKKLVRRIREVAPEFDPAADVYEIAGMSRSVTNPLKWMEQHREALVREVSHSITHGDLTGRNILVSEGGNCWLIDFYRTYPSHILRDFVIMETDIKYRLMPLLPPVSFMALEEYLLQVPGQPSPLTLDALAPPAQKAAVVIQFLRKTGGEFVQRPGKKAVECLQEYWLSLLMATLNVVRLRHIEEVQKRLALLSASLICEKVGETSQVITGY